MLIVSDSFLVYCEMIGWSLTCCRPLQEVVSSVSASYNRSILWRRSAALVVGLQAHCRGFLVRQQLEGRQRYLIGQSAAVVVIQVRAAVAPITIIFIIITASLCSSVSLEEVHPAEGVPPPAAAPLQELEVRRQGNRWFYALGCQHLYSETLR